MGMFTVGTMLVMLVHCILYRLLIIMLAIMVFEIFKLKRDCLF